MTNIAGKILILIMFVCYANYAFAYSNGDEIFYIGDSEEIYNVNISESPGGYSYRYQSPGVQSCSPAPVADTEYFSWGWITDHKLYVSPPGEYQVQCTTVVIYAVVVDANSENWSDVGPPPDADGDGIEDAFDPLPNDPRPFTYRSVESGEDVDGNTVYERFQIKDADGNITFTERGSRDDVDGITYIEMFPGSFKDSSDGFFSNDSSSVENTGSETYNTSQVINENIQTGNDNTGNTVETDYLEDIVTNTNNQLDNQQEIANSLKGIKEGIDTLNQQTFAGTGGQIVSNITTPSASEIADAITANENVKDAELDIEGENVENSLGENDYTDTEFVADDAGEKTLISTILDTFLFNNPVAQYFEDSGITTTGDCSISFDFKGSPVELTMCQYAGAVQAWGAVVLAFTSLLSVIIVFRR